MMGVKTKAKCESLINHKSGRKVLLLFFVTIKASKKKLKIIKKIFDSI